MGAFDMWSYIIDGLLILILVVCVIIGVSKGLFDSVIGLIGTGVSLIAAVFLAKHVANFVNKIFNFENFVLEKLDASNSEGVISFFGGNFTLSNVEVAKFCVWICSVVILFLCILLVIHVIAKIFESVVNNSPTISGVNRVLGMVFGLARGCAISLVLLALCSVLSQVPVIGTPIYDAIQSTKITSKVYNYVDEFVEKNLTKENIQGLIDKIVSENDTESSDETEEGSQEGSGSGGDQLASTRNN